MEDYQLTLVNKSCKNTGYRSNIRNHHHHHHHVAPSTRISLTFTRHPLSSIASSRSSELLYVGSSLSSCFYSSMRRGPLEYITYEPVPSSPVVPHMSGLSNFDIFRDGCQEALQLLLCGVLPPGLVQYCSQHSCVAAVKLSVHTFS